MDQIQVTLIFTICVNLRLQYDLKKMFCLTLQLIRTVHIDRRSCIVEIQKEDFIVQSFNNSERHNYYSRTIYTVENLQELKETKENDYNNYSKHYDHYLENETNFVIPFLSFIEPKVDEIVTSMENNQELSIDKLFWNYILKLFTTSDWRNRIQKDELKNLFHFLSSGHNV